MEEELNENTVTIQPRTTYLSASQLVQRQEPQIGPTLLNVHIPYNSISTLRIERFGCRSLAQWNTEKSMAHVVQKEGKFDTFGVIIQKQLYLEDFETLYLVETGRLQLNHNNMLLCMEQVYLLLLGELASVKFSAYLVYAHLTRAGYILVRHKNKHFDPGLFDIAELTENDCIWVWLVSAVENKAVSTEIKKTQLYATVKRKIELIKRQFIQEQQHYVELPAVEECPKTSANTNVSEGDGPLNMQRPIPAPESLPTCSKYAKIGAQKRKFNVSPQRQNDYIRRNYSNLLDFVDDDCEFKKFQNTFKKFKVIQKNNHPQSYDNTNELPDYNDTDSNTGCNQTNSATGALEDNLFINFDLYLPSLAFKRNSHPPPLMRVLVLPWTDNFPSHREMRAYHDQLYYPSPILVAAVGESKQVQAYLYYFS